MNPQKKTSFSLKAETASADFRLLPISLLAAGIGIAGGFIAFALLKLIALISNAVFFQRLSTAEVRTLADHTLGILVVIVPVIGGLIIGALGKYGSPKIRGHGIPEAMESVLTNRSRISPRVAILKPLSAALAIGTGGPFGAEGPIIQTGGAFGSLIGQIIHVTAAERKVLLASGAAAGMAAIFNTPIAAVILAIELLLFEFKSRSFIPLVIASTLATATHFQLIGREPMFEIGVLDFGIPTNLPFYLILGLICGGAAVFFTKALYWFEDQFERLPIDSMWHPAIGGLALGIIGLFMPRVLGIGYDTISEILNSSLPLTLLLGLMVFKSLALFVAIGSGTSGGLLAPMFMVGAALGGSFALIVNQIVPGASLSPGACALVAMAAFFGAASRATFTFIIFAFEIIQDYHAILPLMLVSVIADGVGLYLMRNSIMTEKLARRGLPIHHEYEPDILQQLLVRDVMDSNPPTVPGTMLLKELADRIAQGDPLLTRHQAIPVLGEDGKVVGIITRGDVLRGLEQSDEENVTVMEAASSNLLVTYPDEPLYEAVTTMLKNDIGRLPVVSRENPQKLIGYLGRAAVLQARLRRISEENVREPGWIGRPA
ncbi:MAG TPA: chloride channel protein [Oceanobacillus sp.]|nr:chloride channel protein [Oceanobacillus sp.]